MAIDKNDLELLSAGYLAAAQKDQDELRRIAAQMESKFANWIAVLETGAMLSLASIGLEPKMVFSEPLEWLVDSIGWQDNRTTCNQLKIGLVTLSGSQWGTTAKSEFMASLLVITGQIIVREHGETPEAFEPEVRSYAADALEATPDSERTPRAVKKREGSSFGGGFWNGVGGLFGLAADIFDIFT